MKTLLIVDGNNIAHRVKYKYDLSHHGKDVSVTYGFVNVLLSYMRKFTPEAIFVAWDGGLPPFRREYVPAYKANRRHGADDPLAWEDFKEQMNEVKEESLRMMGVLSFSVVGVEADDLIYQAATMAIGKYDRTIVVSADNDLLQCTWLLNTYIYNPNKKELLDAEYIPDTYGIPPADFIHWRALQGDSSDNIAGVPGVGPKTATKLFNVYNSLSGIFNAAKDGKLTPKMAEKILAFGLEGVAKNIRVMALRFDRTGSRDLLRRELEYWAEADTSSLKMYLMNKGFVSLMEPQTYKFAKNLREPILSSNDLRTPIVKYYRKPA